MNKLDFRIDFVVIFIQIELINLLLVKRMSNKKKPVQNDESKNICWRFFSFIIVLISILFCLAFYLHHKIESERKEFERKESERKEFERKETLDFSDIRIGLTPFIDQIPVSEGSKKYKAVMTILRIHPNHLASLYAAGESCQTLLDFEQSFEFFSKFLSISPENRIVQMSKNETHHQES
jgi:hypothetical protein